MSEQIGVITEQNDLGLGFDPLNPSDQKSYNESVTKDNKKEKETDDGD